MVKITFDRETAEKIIEYADRKEMPRPLAGPRDEIAAWVYKRLPVATVLSIICG